MKKVVMSFVIFLVLLFGMDLYAVEDNDFGADLPVKISDKIDWTGYAEDAGTVVFTFTYYGKGVPTKELSEIIADNRRVIMIAEDRGKSVRFIVVDEDQRPLILKTP